MATGPSTITGLPTAAALTGAEVLPMDQGGSGLGVSASLTTLSAAIVPTVASIAALRLIKGLRDGQEAFVNGYNTEGDGGGGNFFWNASSVVADNGGTIIQATGVPTGRWYRLYSGPVNVRWFGAKGDGVTNDSAAIIAAVASGQDTYLPAGTYFVNASMQFSNLSNFSIYGDGKGTTVILCSGAANFSNNIFGFTTCSNFRIAGITFNVNNNTSFVTHGNAAVLAVSSTYFSFENCEVLHMLFLGMGADSCQHFAIRGNRITMDATANTQNQSIITSASVSTPTDGIIADNDCVNSGSIFSGNRLLITRNIFNGYGFGGGITTSTSNDCIISENICFGGVGVDSNGIWPAGIELSGTGHIISSNQCYQNSGCGIAVIAQRCLIADNVCWGNGITANDAIHQTGIVAFYGGVGSNANGCHITGNICYDGGSGKQLYGYYENSASLANIALQANNFDGNVTSDQVLGGGAGAYETNKWIAYTPVMSSLTGAITTQGAVNGRYKQIGKTVFVQISGTITTNGTGATGIAFTLPAGPGNVTGAFFYGCGRCHNISAKMLQAEFQLNTQNVNVYNYDGTYPGANGEQLIIYGSYEVA